MESLPNTHIETIFLDSQINESIPISDRGFSYGDGIFETMRVSNGRVPLIEFHLKRLLEGARILGLCSASDGELAFNKALTVALNKASDQSIIKCTLTRGSGGRGYAPPVSSSPKLYVQLIEGPFPIEQGILHLRFATHRLSENMSLAGIKHLNRLDQVLASSELITMNASSKTDAVDELLVLSQGGNVIEGCASNFLFSTNEGVFTPPITSCGVRGTLREFLLENSKNAGIEIKLQDINPNQFNSLSGAALINSVRGLRQISKVADINIPQDKRFEVLAKYVKEALS